MKAPRISLVLPAILPAVLLLSAPHAAEAEGDAAAPVVTTVIQAADTAALSAAVGSEAIVEGVVTRVGATHDKSITFINFGSQKTGFVVVVFSKSYPNFPDGLEKYSNARVRVKGTVDKFKDQLQIKVSTPDQLEIVPSAP